MARTSQSGVPKRGQSKVYQAGADNSETGASDAISTSLLSNFTVLTAKAVVQVLCVDVQYVDESGKELTDVRKNDDLRSCVQTARRR